MIIQISCLCVFKVEIFLYDHSQTFFLFSLHYLFSHQIVPYRSSFILS
ncbi:hypothetical protein E2C01_050431 [Portunus trituberculatus]|uniref:Uncharacterized protein n=1 Tax=Portunus trituberculatus TaxID=210409 RepID=A0A5B7G8Z2_PORTR|nr:hypothetical protein [Portunus trituberculatus]